MTVTFSILQMNNYIYFFNNRFWTSVVHAQEIFSFFKITNSNNNWNITGNVLLDKEGRHLKAYLKIFKLYRNKSQWIRDTVLFFCLYFLYVKYTSILYKKYRHIYITCTISRSICLTNFIFDRMNRAMSLTIKGSNLRVNIQTTTSVV